ncbi:MAG: phytoene desaturase family protein [Corynebacterium sp.]|nr:phytoene desaturase family protein [Corynebacterium sp.]
MTDKRNHVVIIGGGIAGLASAALAAEKGLQVTLVEKNSYLGGRAHSIEVDSSAGSFRFDCGPSWYLMPEAFERFYSHMGTSAKEQLDLCLLDPAYRVFSSDRVAEPIVVCTGREKMIAQAESLEPGAGERMAQYLDTATQVYEVALKFFLYTNFDSVLPFVRLELLKQSGLMLRLLRTNLAHYVDSQFSSPEIRKILEYPAVFLSTIPSQAPALYSLLSHTDLVDGVRYPMGGFSTFINSLRTLCEQRGVQILTNTDVVDILYTELPGPITKKMGLPTGSKNKQKNKNSTKKARVRGVRVHHDGRGYENIEADYVISAGDRHHTETVLLPPHLRTWPHKYWKKRNPGISAIVGLVGIQGKLEALGHHQLFLSDNWEPDFEAITHGEPSRSFYVCKTTATDDSMAPAGCENLFILIPTGPDSSFGPGDVYREGGDGGVDKQIDEALEVIARHSGLDFEQLAERILVRRSISPRDFEIQYYSWRSSALGLAHTLGQSAFFRGKNESATVDGLYYAGATSSPGVGIPMCLISAENALAAMGYSF